MKNLVKTLSAGVLAIALAGCTVGGSAPAASNTPAAPGSDAAEGGKKLVGVLQLVQHPALDAATQGFMDAITEAFGDEVEFDVQNAAGDTATANTIAASLVAEECDLVLGNATPALQALVSATNTIPVLGTAVTEYGTALGIENFSGTVGGNISGASDLAPLDQQAAMFTELLPEATKIGILYCSAEPNSVYQAKVVEEELTKAGKTVTVYTFSDSNDISAVTQTACAENDALYIPTDNTAASCTEAINNVASVAGTPIIAGEEGICAGCGIATLSISYYDLGVATGNMAVKILNGADVGTLPVTYAETFTKKYNPALCEALGIAIPEGYAAIEG